MSILERAPEFVDSKKLLNLLNKYKNNFKKDKYCDEEKLLTTIYDKQRRNKGYFKPMYLKPKILGSREYCKTGYGAMSRIVRNYLADGIYLDIDMKNSVYNIFLSIARTNNLKHTALEFYVENRDEVIGKVMTDNQCSRDEAKKVFNKMWFTALFDKKILPDEDFYELKKEVRKVQKYVINTTDITEFKKLYKPDDYNYYGKILSQIYFCIEWDIVTSAIEFLKEQEYEVCADLHDGFFVMIKEDDDNFESNINQSLIDLNKYIFEEKDYKVEFIIKPMTEKLDIDETEEVDRHLELYMALKYEFERSVVRIDDLVKFVVDDAKENTFKLYNKTDLLTRFEDYYSMEKFTIFSKTPLSFIKTWLLDPEKRKYRKMDFIPDCTKCPDDIYNVFKGFDIANYTDSFDGEISEHDEKSFQLILDHIKFLCTDGGDEAINMYEYGLNWMAQLFEKPSDKATTALIFKGYKGCGKGILFHLLKSMLGDSYGYTTANPMCDIFGNFNSSSANKMLINIDEIDTKQAKGIYEALKKYVTEDTLEYKQKFCDAHKVKNLSRMLITTNNDYNLPISESNRRFVLIECKHKKTPTIDTIESMLNNKNAHMLFYKFLMNRSIAQIKFEKFPKSKMYLKALEASAKPILDFLDSISDTQFSNHQGLQSTSITSLYQMYVSWARETNSFCQKRKDFKCDLMEGNQVFKEVRTKTARLICWDRDDFNEYLKANGFQPPPDFEPDTDDETAFD